MANNQKKLVKEMDTKAAELMNAANTQLQTGEMQAVEPVAEEGNGENNTGAEPEPTPAAETTALALPKKTIGQKIDAAWMWTKESKAAKWIKRGLAVAGGALALKVAYDKGAQSQAEADEEILIDLTEEEYKEVDETATEE